MTVLGSRDVAIQVFFVEPTCASCTVGSYAPLSVCLSVCGRNSKLVNSHNPAPTGVLLFVYACHMWKSEGGLCVNVKLHFFVFCFGNSLKSIKSQ